MRKVEDELLKPGEQEEARSELTRKDNRRFNQVLTKSRVLPVVMVVGERVEERENEAEEEEEVGGG